MRRTTLEVDESVLARVQEVLGTKGVKPTIDAALAEVLRQDAWRKLRSWAVENDDLRNPELAARAWPELR